MKSNRRSKRIRKRITPQRVERSGIEPSRIAQSLARFEAIVRDSQDAIVSQDLAGRVLSWNLGAERISGYSASEVIGKTLQDFPETALFFDADLALLEQVATGQSVLHYETKRRVKDGRTIEIQMTVSPLRNEFGKVIAISKIARDITEQKNAERALQRAKENADRANLSKSLFLANMSHEIRTPMNSIVGLVDVLEETPLTEEQRRILATVKRAGQSLLGLINDILDVSKVEAGKLRIEKIQFHLEETLDQVVELMASRAHDKKIEVVYEIDERIPLELQGDPFRLRQIMMNLLSNAIKFTERNGQVDLRVRFSEIMDKKVWVEFEVKDNGIGIAEDKLISIFESYAQAEVSTSRNFGGTGLGLNISQQLTELMGGTIGVQSTLGKGSCFTVRIPFLFEGELPILSPGERNHRLSGRRVLLIDAHIEASVVTQRILESWGAKVVSCTTGEQAWLLARQSIEHESPFDFVLLNPDLPDFTGEEILKRFRMWREVFERTILLLDGYASRVDFHRSKEFGSCPSIIRPVRRTELNQVMQTVSSSKVLSFARSRDNDLRADLFSTKRILEGPQARGEDCPGEPMVSEHTRIGRNQGVIQGANSAEEKGSSRCILIVDDSEDNRNLLQFYLRATGYRLIIAENGERGYEEFRKQRFDLVLMDVHMPILDGYGATEKIRNFEKENSLEPTPIVALTANAFSEDAERSFAVGCTEHLTKPVKKKVLLEVVEQILRKKAS